MRRLGLVLLLSILGACSSTADPCRLNSDCAPGLLCTAGECVPECRQDRDCSAPQVCARNRCTDPEPGEQLCSRLEDCPRNQVCQAGVCGVPSLLALDSGVAVSDGGAPADAAGDAGPGDAVFFDATAPRDAGADAGIAADAAAPLLPYGAVCARAAECATNLCLGVAGATTGRCTQTCQTDTQCAYPDRCVAVGTDLLCGPSTSGRATGEPCPNGPSDCATGICVADGGAQFCSHQCSPLPSCPAQMTCAPLPDGQGGAVALCVPGNGLGFGDLCARSSDCGSGLCVGLSGSSDGVCTAFCDQVPCPLGWSCSSVSDGAGSTVRICGPGSASGGGFGTPCTGASGCASGFCLSDARTGSAFCTIPCTRAADCAQISGLTCVALSTGEQVCAPP